MKLKNIIFILLAVMLLSAENPLAASLREAGQDLENAVESMGDSIGSGLHSLGQELNRANDSFLDMLNRDKASDNSYEAQIAKWRRLENARVKELAAMTGVSEEYIRQLRSEGLTWDQIAAKYGINPQALPAPEVSNQLENGD